MSDRILVILTGLELSVARTSRWRKKLQPSKERAIAHGVLLLDQSGGLHVGVLYLE